MTCSVLIVEDEHLIAEGIRFLIERLVPECRVLCLAADGLEGYEKAMELLPQIVLTDIRMPELDGIQMIQRLKEEGNPARFVILSGYAEFEYAKKAMALGVEDYILKPVEEEELRSVLSRCCQFIWETQKKNEMLSGMSHSLKEYVLKDVLESSDEDIAEKKTILEKLGFPVMCRWFSCIIFENAREGKKDERPAFSQMVEELAEAYFSFSTARIVVPYSASMAVVILGFENKENRQKVISAAGRLRADAAQRQGSAVSGGAGLLHEEIEEIRESFEEARCALNYKVLKGLDCLISYEEIQKISVRPQLIEREDAKRLEACIDTMDDLGCRRVIEEIFRKVEGDLTFHDLQLLSLNLILIGIRRMPFMQFQLNEYLGRNILSLESIAKFQTIEQLKNWIINMIKSMNELMLKENIPEKQDVVAKAKEYIDKNFNKKISLNDISERFYINPYYFSQLFKKKTGETYQNYITGLRVKRAARLLEETDLKIYEICEIVGYTDTNHFNKIFENHLGLKPSDYRKNSKRK